MLATSRQDTREPGVRSYRVDKLGRDPAILLLTENAPGAGRFAWERWGRVAKWIGDLPIAIDLLNRCLAFGSVTAAALFARAEDATKGGRNTAVQLDEWREALRGQRPERLSFRDHGGIPHIFRESGRSIAARGHCSGATGDRAHSGGIGGGARQRSLRPAGTYGTALTAFRDSDGGRSVRSDAPADGGFSAYTGRKCRGYGERGLRGIAAAS